MKRMFLLALLAATAATAGPYDQPYAIITVESRPPVADPKLVAAILNRVDGEDILYSFAVVAPGVHRVTLDLPPRKGSRLATQETFALTAKPCTRYYVAARLESAVGQRWTPVVRSEERIGECEHKFNLTRK